MSGSGASGEPQGLELLSTRASTERDLAHGVTRWMTTNFQHELADAVRSTPFSVPLLCAIACREAGGYWLPLTPHKSAADLLGLMVYDASGDVPNAPRTAFPVNTSAFRMKYGDQFTAMLIDETNKARAARGLSPAAMVYKGYGIFQYDLQSVLTDEAFFRSRQWYSFADCVGRAVMELTSKFERTHDIQEAVRAYNGSGPNAEQYARDVMRLLPFCEEAIVGTPSPFVAMPQAAPMAPPGPSRTNPAAPAEGEISDTADLDTARMLANLGAPGSVAEAAPAAAPPIAAPGAPALLPFDLSVAHAFLDACLSSHPRVTYGLGKKVPFLHAVPGRDFTQVDCSGFVREAVRLATTPTAAFPDGSVVQHDWIRAHGFEASSVSAAMANDGVIRIAFLRPQDVPAPHIGHVVLIAGGRTLESHGGVGPDSRPWTGEDWQAKTFVYVLARPAQPPMAASVTSARRGAVGGTMSRMAGEGSGAHEVVVVTDTTLPRSTEMASPAAAPPSAPTDVVRAARDLGLTLRPMFVGSGAAPRAIAAPATGAPEAAAPRHPELEAIEAEQSRFLVMHATTREDAERAVQSLKGLPGIQTAYIKPAVEPPLAPTYSPSATGTIPDFNGSQGYLNDSPGGVGARAAWKTPGGRGSGVRLIDVEGGWTLDHLDLRDNTRGLLGGQPFTTTDWTDHGTAVLGVIRGDDNGFGITGIAPDANYGVVSHANLGSAGAIDLASRQLVPGDLLLLEMHRPGPRFNYAVRQDQVGYIAIEWWPDDFLAIRRAVLSGIIVIEAAGNGAQDLDDPFYDQPDPAFLSSWQNPFRGGRDSGAILVGAGAPPSGQFGPDRSRLDFSNYGSRVDCQGWGRGVVSCGYGDLFGGTDEAHRAVAYTSQFSGTSSASPMVTGVLACIQGIARALGQPIDPALARNLLRQTGAPQTASSVAGIGQRIGNRPNLAELIQRITPSPPAPRP